MFFYGKYKTRKFDLSHQFGLHNFLLNHNNIRLDNFFLIDFFKSLFQQITNCLIVYKYYRLTLCIFYIIYILIILVNFLFS